MSFESFPNMNNQPNPGEKGIPVHLTQEQIDRAAADVEKSSLRGVGLTDYEVVEVKEKPAERKPLVGKDSQWVGSDFDVKHGIKNNPFDEAGRHVVGSDEAKKADELLKKRGVDTSGLTLQ